MQAIKELIDVDKQQKCSEVFDDERIISSLYYASFSKPIRSILNDGKRKEEFIKMNEWLKEVFPRCEDISCISGDRVKQSLVEQGVISQELQSCDAFLMLKADNREDDCLHHLMIEFKNTDRETLLESYLGEGDEYVLNKCRGMAHVFTDHIYFFDKGDGKAVLKNTHLAIVYSGSATGVKDGPADLVADEDKKKKEVWKNSRSKSDRRQRRAAPMTLRFALASNKDRELLADFETELDKLGYASAGKEYIKVGEPKFIKEKGKKPKRTFSLLTAKNLSELYDTGFFDNMIYDYEEIL